MQSAVAAREAVVTARARRTASQSGLAPPAARGAGAVSALAARRERFERLDRGTAVGGVLVSDRGVERLIVVDEIIWLEAERDYVRVHTPERSYLVHQTLQRLADQLAPYGFTRVHRSAVVNDARVAGRTRRKDGGLRLLLVGGDELPMGRRYADQAFANRAPGSNVTRFARFSGGDR